MIKAGGKAGRILDIFRPGLGAREEGRQSQTGKRWCSGQAGDDPEEEETSPAENHRRMILLGKWTTKQ